MLSHEWDLTQRCHQLLAHCVQMLLSNHFVLLKFELSLHDEKLVVLVFNFLIEMIDLRRLLLKVFHDLLLIYDRWISLDRSNIMLVRIS